jgi:hypothetical protein
MSLPTFPDPLAWFRRLFYGKQVFRNRTQFLHYDRIRAFGNRRAGENARRRA